MRSTLLLRLGVTKYVGLKAVVPPNSLLSPRTNPLSYDGTAITALWLWSLLTTVRALGGNTIAIGTDQYTSARRNARGMTAKASQENKLGMLERILKRSSIAETLAARLRRWFLLPALVFGFAENCLPMNYHKSWIKAMLMENLKRVWNNVMNAIENIAVSSCRIVSSTSFPFRYWKRP